MRRAKTRVQVKTELDGEDAQLRCDSGTGKDVGVTEWACARGSLHVVGILWGTRRLFETGLRVRND